MCDKSNVMHILHLELNTPCRIFSSFWPRYMLEYPILVDLGASVESYVKALCLVVELIQYWSTRKPFLLRHQLLRIREWGPQKNKNKKVIHENIHCNQKLWCSIDDATCDVNDFFPNVWVQWQDFSHYMWILIIISGLVYGHWEVNTVKASFYFINSGCCWHSRWGYVSLWWCY